jgi:hypothetical protein
MAKKIPDLIEHRICVRVMDDDREHIATIASLLPASGTPSATTTVVIREALRHTAEALKAGPRLA